MVVAAEVSEAVAAAAVSAAVVVAAAPSPLFLLGSLARPPSWCSPPSPPPAWAKLGGLLKRYHYNDYSLL
jgi:hypothetical protein